MAKKTRIMDFTDICVSYYQNVADQRPSTITLADWISGIDRYNAIIDMIRRADPVDQKRLKKKLPAITPSGIFSGRGEKHLQYHSGIICIDIDDVDPDYAKKLLMRLQYVAYAGRSASGGGVYAFIPIKEPQRHKMHFRAIKKDMEAYGLTADPMCANVSNLRFYSYDNEAYINANAVTYQKTLKEPRKSALRNVYVTDIDTDNNGCLIKRIIDEVERMRADVTATYADWLKVGSVLASLYGEGGRSYYHRLSQYHPEYQKGQTDNQYNKCLAYGGMFGIGMLLDVCKQYGVKLAGSGYPSSRPADRSPEKIEFNCNDGRVKT